MLLNYNNVQNKILLRLLKAFNLNFRKYAKTSTIYRLFQFKF